jgi:fluoroquinolone transport system ATP-binding protein
MLQIQGLSYTYPKTQTQALKGIDFSIDKGEVFGFLGPSGSGKTTTQRVLIGLLKGYTGKVQFMGKERHEWDRSFFEHVGVAFDFPNLYQKLSAIENLNVIGAYYRDRHINPLHLLERVGLLPDKDKRVESFSKGMKMRLNFVRSLLHDPDFLFFDEPTSGLDPVNAKIIKDMIIELKERGKTVFLTTHNMVVADQLCDRVAFLVDGAIPVMDTPDALKLRYGQKRVRVGFHVGEDMQEEEFPIEGIGYNIRFQQILKEDRIKTLHSQEATLEEIFIHLTGRELL